MATTTSHRPPPPRPLDLDITIVSAKHLKNVNWRNGDLSPYVIFWLDPDHRLATKSDDSNSTKPVWNERFLIPLSSHPTTSVLNLEIFHSKPSDTPKPLIGSLRLPINDLPNPNDSTVIRTFDLRRPSGRPNGKIRLKLSLRERPLPDYQNTPLPSYYYNTAPLGRYPPSVVAPPPAPVHTYHYGSYSDPYSGYYSGGYYSQQPPTPRPYVGRPSAPVDNAQQYELKPRTGLGVGALSGGLAGLSIDEGGRYEEERHVRGDGSEVGARELDDYSDYRRRMDY